MPVLQYVHVDFGGHDLLPALVILSGNKNIISLAVTLAKLTNLQQLNLSMCGFKNYPQIVSELTALQDLNLSGNEDNMTMSLGGNKSVVSLPESLAQLTNLQKLDVSNSEIKKYPEVLSKLIAL